MRRVNSTGTHVSICLLAVGSESVVAFHDENSLEHRAQKEHRSTICMRKKKLYAGLEHRLGAVANRLCGTSTAPWNRWFWVPMGEDSEDGTSFSEKDNGIDEEGFAGNMVMVWCIGLLVLVLHLLLVSAMEAYWLQSTKVLLIDLIQVFAVERITAHHLPLIFCHLPILNTFSTPGIPFLGR